jgi:uncharacterized protein YwgA
MGDSKPEFDVDDAVVLMLGADPGPRERRGELRGITRLEKLIFLLEKETDAPSFMTEDPAFEAYNFGPFSRKVYQAIDTLSAAGLIEDSVELSRSNDDQIEASKALGQEVISAPYSTRDLTLTDLGKEYYDALLSELPKSLIDQAARLRQRFAGWSLRDLISYVYRNYNSYTEKSLIRDEILGDR